MGDFHRQLLIRHSQCPRTPLPALQEMEESPPGPAPPPKDPWYSSSMETSRPPTATASGSKRKRDEAQDDAGHLLVPNTDDHTPKRSRSVRGVVSDGDISTDDTPMHDRGLRRKKGIHNLSTVNLRHAASMANLPQRQASPTRESKFQEGSLTDKPSEKPPSVFTRLLRTDSGNLVQVDQLMEDYHDGVPLSTRSIEATLEYEKATRDQRVAEITAARQKKEENNGFFRFGKSIAASFNPVTIFNRLWTESKNDLADQVEEGERKQRSKMEVEARYAELKNAGQFNMKHVALTTPHDSAVALDHNMAFSEHQRNTSYGSVIRTPYDDMASVDGHEVPESATKHLRSSKSRLHLRRPSLQSLKGGLKRIGSMSNLGAAPNRESSSSASPIKADFEVSALRKSYSKFDLKKQDRLTKRVSDLEVKLQKARGELKEALAEASPMPRLGDRYQRFTPYGEGRRPKFVPGALATLPSERLLFQEQLGAGGEQERVVKRHPRKALDLNTAFENIDDDEEEERQVKSDQPQHPARASSLATSRQQSEPLTSSHDNRSNHLTNITEPSSKGVTDENMDPNSIATDLKGSEAKAEQPATYNDLDQKLKALDANIKTAKKSASKKRSSQQANDKDYRPGAESDDDAEWERAARQPKKKRKASTKSEASPENKRGKKQSPRRKASAKNVTAKFSPDVSEPAEGPKASEVNQPVVDTSMLDVAAGEEELAKTTSVRNSIGSEDQTILEPVYEEEEETSITTTTETTSIAVNDEPSKPTAKATPARYLHTAARSRSNSPRKPNGPVRAGTEESLMTSAANAAQLKRTSRSHSPPPTGDETSKANAVDEVVKLVPGQAGVPKLPKGANGSFESLPNADVDVEVGSNNGNKRKRGPKDDSFEWPEDVF